MLSAIYVIVVYVKAVMEISEQFEKFGELQCVRTRSVCAP